MREVNEGEKKVHRGFMGGQQIAGMPLFIFLGLATCILFSGWNGSLPLGVVGALALMFMLGTLLTELGERIMPIREYLGGTILAIFGGAALFEYQLLPVILPLSNPTRSAEDSPEQVWEATAGRALLATGSPFSPVMVAGEWRGSQCNHVYVFPWIGRFCW